MKPQAPLLASAAVLLLAAAASRPRSRRKPGLSGIFSDREGSHAHGLDERLRVKSLIDAREYLYRLVKLYAAK